MGVGGRERRALLLLQAGGLQAAREWCSQRQQQVSRPQSSKPGHVLQIAAQVPEAYSYGSMRTRQKQRYVAAVVRAACCFSGWPLLQLLRACLPCTCPAAPLVDLPADLLRPPWLPCAAPLPRPCCLSDSPPPSSPAPPPLSCRSRPPTPTCCTAWWTRTPTCPSTARPPCWRWCPRRVWGREGRYGVGSGGHGGPCSRAGTGPSLPMLETLPALCMPNWRLQPVCCFWAAGGRLHGAGGVGGPSNSDRHGGTDRGRRVRAPARGWVGWAGCLVGFAWVFAGAVGSHCCYAAVGAPAPLLPATLPRRSAARSSLPCVQAAWRRRSSCTCRSRRRRRPAGG